LRIDVNEALELVVTEELDRLGYDLVELRAAGSKARPTLQLRIDRRDGVAVTVSDCSIVSRAVEARLEAEKKVGPEYVLEVSSPARSRLGLTLPNFLSRLHIGCSAAFAAGPDVGEVAPHFLFFVACELT
jgi:ribosome maturation factor RimP